MLKHEKVSEAVLKAFYRVYNKLGYGFLEKVYENAMRDELRKQGLAVIQQAPIQVFYDDEQVGDFFADLLVENCIIVELKAVDALAKEHSAQLLNYLKATEIEVGLLLNFGPKLEMKRKVFDNELKAQAREEESI